MFPIQNSYTSTDVLQNVPSAVFVMSHNKAKWYSKCIQKHRTLYLFVFNKKMDETIEKKKSLFIPFASNVLTFTIFSKQQQLIVQHNPRQGWFTPRNIKESRATLACLYRTSGRF